MLFMYCIWLGHCYIFNAGYRNIPRTFQDSVYFKPAYCNTVIDYIPPHIMGHSFCQYYCCAVSLSSVFDPVQHPYTKMTQNERIYSYHKYKEGMAHEFWNYTDPGSPDLEKASKGYYKLLSNRIGGKAG